MGCLILYHTPSLSNPCLVAGFAGWPNAGEVSTGAVGYLKNKLGARKCGEISPEEFYNFSLARPVAAIQDGFVQGVKFPSNEFFYWKNEQQPRDLILLQGTEPLLHWGKFIDCVLQAAQQFGVRRIYTIGGTYDRVPHTREPRVTAVINKPELQEELWKHGVPTVNYQGPISLHTVLLVTCGHRNIEAIGLWGHTPHYIQAVWNPKVSRAILEKLSQISGIPFDLEELRGAGDYLDQVLNRLMGQNEQLRRYVKKLEEEYERVSPGEAGAVEPAEESERIIREIEDFLRREQRREEQ